MPLALCPMPLALRSSPYASSTCSLTSSIFDSLNEKYYLDLPKSDDYETLAGLIIHFHESIPDRGEKIRIRPFLFEILQASESKIELVKLQVEEA